MAKLEITNARIRLKPRELERVRTDMNDLVGPAARKRAALAAANFRRRAKFRNQLDRVLRQSGIDLSALRGSTNKDFRALAAKLVKSHRKLGRVRRRRGRPNTVWGLTSGVERPTYDLRWTSTHVVGPPANAVARADAATGRIETFSWGSDSKPEDVNTYAGVGFWYVPNRVGVLNVSIGPHLLESLWTAADWNDVGAAGGWISLGIAAYLRDPFQLTRWETIQTNELWKNEDNWFDSTEHTEDFSSYSMRVSTLADTAHYYACWVWLHSWAHAENGGSSAGAYLKADVGGFTYNLT
jgi:hypothetical protein